MLLVYICACIELLLSFHLSSILIFSFPLETHGTGVGACFQRPHCNIYYALDRNDRIHLLHKHVSRGTNAFSAGVNGDCFYCWRRARLVLRTNVFRTQDECV